MYAEIGVLPDTFFLLAIAFKPGHVDLTTFTFTMMAWVKVVKRKKKL